MKVKLVSQTTGSGEFAGKTAEELIVHNARVSSPRVDKFEKPEGLINYCIKNHHWSIFEQANLCFEVITSRAISAQILRHSIRPQEFSQRYADVASIEPIEFRLQAETNRQSSSTVIGTLYFGEYPFETKPDEVVPDSPYYGHFDIERLLEGEGSLADRFENDPLVRWLDETGEALGKIKQLYEKGLKLGVARECARFILPMASTTVLYLQGSVRQWIHYLEVRTDEHTQKEHREVAQAIKEIFKQELPIISKALNY